MGIGPVQAGEQDAAPEHPARRALRDAAHHLKGRALKIAGFLVVVYVVLKVIPALKDALHSLERVSWEWVVAAIGLEILSETGFVVAWSAIVDPQKVLGGGGRGRHMDEDVAWAQLGGGLVVPGGSSGRNGGRRRDSAPLRDADEADRRAPVQPQLPQHRRRCDGSRSLRRRPRDSHRLRRRQPSADAAPGGGGGRRDHCRAFHRPPCQRAPARLRDQPPQGREPRSPRWPTRCRTPSSCCFTVVPGGPCSGSWPISGSTS